MASLYRRLIAPRRAHPALVAGSIDGVAVQGEVLCYGRHYDEERLLVMLNTGSEVAEAAGAACTAIASTYGDRTGLAVGARLTLRPHPARPQPLGAILSCVLVAKSPASWRSCSWLDGSPETRLTIRPRCTAGRAAMAAVQRCTFA